MVMFQFVKVKYKHPKIKEPLDHEWMLKIDSIVSLEQYERKSTIYKNALQDLLDAWEKRKHARNPLSAIILSFCELKESNYFAEADILFTKTTLARLEVLKNHGVIYINRNGGFFPGGNGVIEYSDIMESDKLYFPTSKERDIRFLQWPGGKHWYVKVDDLDVVVDGEQKWNTKKKAEEALNKWKLENTYGG